MPTKLIYSATASGKTAFCLEQIHSLLKQHPLAKVRVIVPDRLQAGYFRRRLSISGGSLGVYVGTFNDLYKSILEKVGGYVPLVSNALQYRIVQEIVDSTPLRHYASLRTQPGFLLSLVSSFAELKRALVYPESYIESSRDALPARQELAQLYAAYQSKLRGMGWADYEGLSWLAVAALEEHPGRVDESLQLIVVDGFDSFIETQKRILSLLGKSSNLLITLPGEVNSTRVAHQRFARTLSALQNELSCELLNISSKTFLPEELAQVEKRLFEPATDSLLNPNGLFLRELRSPAEESLEALRWIKSLVIREGISLHDCAVFVPVMEQYQPYLRSAAREFGVPVHFTKNAPLTASPAINAVSHLLNLPVQNFRSNELFKVLRSPYFSFGLSLEDVDNLDLISRRGKIVEGWEQWQEIWVRLSLTVAGISDEFEEERTLRDLPRGDVAHTLQACLDGFFQTISPPVGTRTQTEWTRWLEELLANLHFHENINSQQDEIALEGFREALRALVMSESVAGDRLVDYQQFLSDLQSTLTGTALSEPSASGGSLLIGDMREARGIRFKAVALLGLSEGLFPAVEQSDPFLPEDLRAELGLDSRLERDQGSLFYQAITRADTHLLLTRPYLSEEGEKWEASPYWNAVVSLYEKDNAVQTLRPDDSRPLAEAASSQELLFWAVRRKGLPRKYSDLEARWRQLQHASHVIQARRTKRAAGAFEGGTQSLIAELATLFPPEKIWSASRLESYGTCPHMFFVKQVLDLEVIEPPSLDLDPAQLGSVLHEILEKAYQRAKDPGIVDSVLEVLPEVAKSVFVTAPQVYGFRSSGLWELEQAQWLEKLKETIIALANASNGWVPFAYEQAFGIGEAPPLEMKLDGQKVLMRGLIDRIDRDANGNLRVVDYKTGSSYLDAKALINGRRLQLPLYALAAKKALQLGEPVEGFYWKINAADSSSLKLSKFATESGTGIEAAIQIAEDHLVRILKGIRSGDFPPIPPKGGCPKYCPAVQWCWRYQKEGWS